MKKITSISAFHSMLSLPSPLHPLVSVIRLEEANLVYSDIWQSFQREFYSIALKRDARCKTRYGQKHYDFDKGIMSFTVPEQVQSLVPEQVENAKGIVLLFHPDFLAKHPLANAIRTYGFFHYAVDEALHLSEKEEADITLLLEKIHEESSRIDRHTQEIILSHIGLLLSYARRFYERQFITRHKVSQELLDRFRQLIVNHLEDGLLLEKGRLTVNYLAEQLHLSPDYLSDMLRTHTGQNAQQHLQHMLMEKARELLSSTSMTVAEIAYYLGFEYPQSFNKLFKSKTDLSPLQFRRSLN